MRLIAIGDTHGRDDWKQILRKETNSDKIIFMGDYFDSKDNISYDIQKQNFIDICIFAKLNKNVVLLFGNHDYHYLSSTSESYSGFNSIYKTDISILLSGAINDGLIRMCYKESRFLFSHAGVTKTWCRNNDIQSEYAAMQINDLFLFKPNKFRFTKGNNNSSYGDDITQSPIWVRPKSLSKDLLTEYTQVVGHTVQDNITHMTQIVLIDTIASRQYLSITNGKIKTESY